MNSALAATLGFFLSILLIIRKIPPIFSLMLGAIAGGLLAGWTLPATLEAMFGGIKEMVPAIARVLAAGVLSGMLIVTGAAESIALTFIRSLGEKRVFFALALSAMLLTAIGVFVDVAIITVAPVALSIAARSGISHSKLLIAMIGGGKCGNIISPNPNTIIAAQNFDTPLQQVMFANLIPALIGLAFTLLVIVRLVPSGKNSGNTPVPTTDSAKSLPPFWAAIAGPAVAIGLLTLRPLTGIDIDPLIALPAGGLLGILTTRSWNRLTESLSFGVKTMSGIAVLLIGTGTIAGVIKASAIKDVIVALLAGWSEGGVLLAPITGTLMSAATASATAGATIASASFAEAILASGVSPVAGAAMINASTTIFSHLPHGALFHASGGSMGMPVAERMKLIPYESLLGLVITLASVLCCTIG